MAATYSPAGAHYLVDPGRQEPFRRDIRSGTAEAADLTKYGKSAVVVVAANEYERIRQLERLKVSSFAGPFFRDSDRRPRIRLRELFGAIEIMRFDLVECTGRRMPIDTF